MPLHKEAPHVRACGANDLHTIAQHTPTRSGMQWKHWFIKQKAVVNSNWGSLAWTFSCWTWFILDWLVIMP